MKASKTKYLLIAALALFAAFQIGACFLNLYSRGIILGSGHIGGDLELRYNEVCCAHRGVNSFRIWNREMTLPGFVPFGRPDKEAVKYKEGDSRVHAYPPWHVMMFWFYGWLPKATCVSLMSVVLGFCLCFICYESVRLAKERFKPYGYIVVFSLTLIAYNTSTCFSYLNYSVLILAMFLLMNKALKTNHSILAGLAWAVMMIKPQVGLLFVWPLFWQKHYLTILTAVTLCLAATFGMSILVNEPVLDLILQIPKIGQPYVRNASEYLKFISIIYEKIPFLIPAFAFLIVGGATWRLKRQDFLDCCVPVVLMIPIWTYSISLDWIILLPAFILLLGRISTQPKFDVLSGVSVIYAVSMTILSMIVTHIYVFNCVVAKFFPTIEGAVVFDCLKYANILIVLALIVCFDFEMHKKLNALRGESLRHGGRQPCGGLPGYQA